MDMIERGCLSIRTHPQASAGGGRTSVCRHRRCAAAALPEDQYPVALEREGAGGSGRPGGGCSSTGGELDGGGAAELAGKDNQSAAGATSARLEKGGLAAVVCGEVDDGQGGI